MSGMELEEKRVSKAEQTADAMDAESKDAVKKLMENRVESILDRDRKRVSDLFFRLDLDKSGVLTSQDFEHPIPAVQAKLQQIWGHISNEFDFNSDGEDDLVVLDESGFSCEDSASMYCGSAGCVVHFTTSADYSYGYIRDWQFVKTQSDKPVILFNLHGVACGEVGTTPCYSVVSIFEGRFISTAK